MRIAPETPQSDMVLHPNEIKKRVQQLLHGERTRNGRSCVRVSHMFHMIYIAWLFHPFLAIDVSVLDAASIRITARSQ